jgi:hypothetical protein
MRTVQLYRRSPREIPDLHHFCDKLYAYIIQVYLPERYRLVGIMLIVLYVTHFVMYCNQIAHIHLSAHLDSIVVTRIKVPRARMTYNCSVGWLGQYTFCKK